MLKELRIENFAIIDHLELQFPEGFIVLTGETGAGKSIIMDALNTLLGSRPDSSVIRRGAERAIIEATFQIPESLQQPINDLLSKDELTEETNIVLLEREIRRNGRNIARINGHAVNVSLLKEVGEYLVDMHGQSDHLSLLKVNQHIKLLDRFAKISLPLENYRKTYRELTKINRELNKLKQNEQDAARLADLLTYQINEINAANLKVGEEETLVQERNRLSNAENLASACQEALTLLDIGNPEVPSISDLFGQTHHAIQKISKLDPSQEEMENFTALIEGNLSELALNLRNYLESIEFNPKRLQQIEERLETIYSLKRKYGDTIEKILEFLNKAQAELESITHAEETIDALETQKQTLLQKIVSQGLELSAKRHEAAQKLEQLLLKEFEALKMPQARFQVNFNYKYESEGVRLPNGETVSYDANGLESVEFFIETNPGEGMKPLTKIASGGETARIMLALKNVLAQADHVPTLIFDEIDQGIGGRIGTTVGYKLWNLTAQHQVICITHLPQLAAFGNTHFRVAKTFEDNRTTTIVEEISGEKRVHELAKMLGKLSESTIQSAQELLQTVTQYTHPTS